MTIHALLLVATLTAPRPALTPGVARSLTTRQVCQTKWGRDRRFVTQAMKQHVFAAYGIPWSQRARFEVDHLISRDLAGADHERNLWPQPLYDAHQKDRLEVKLKTLVCRGALTLAFAQQAIRSDWRAAYRLYVVAR
jgi:hypothetical protein